MMRRNHSKLSILIVLTGVIPLFTQPNRPLKINEFMACNTFTQLNPQLSDFEDWIEIYNDSDQEADMGGLYLTDDLDDPFKWWIPQGLVIGARNFFIFWADGSGFENRAGFKLSQNGESIGIFDSDGAVIDTLTFGPQFSDVSCGRYPDGGPARMYFGAPTFGVGNLPGVTAPRRAEDPVFTVPGGLYQGSLSVSLLAADNSRIYFTVDGAFPDTGAVPYLNSIEVDASTVIRARAYRDGYLPSRVVTQTYILNKTIRLPVVALSTDPGFLFDPEIGITPGLCVDTEVGAPPPFDPEANFWNDWERPAHIEFFDPGESGPFGLDVGIQVFGGYFGRQIPQKAFTVFMRDKYGAEEIEYPLFPCKAVTRFKRFVLRASSNDFNRTFFRDGMMTTLLIGRMDVDYQAYRPAVGYVNGQYWGIYNIREKMNEYYAESNYGIDAEDVEWMQNVDGVATGDGDGYHQLMEYVGSHDMADSSVYAHVQSLVDIDEFMNYHIAQFYFRNHDWLVQNIRYWRESSGGKWRWMLYDLDWGFSGEIMQGTEQYKTNSIRWALNLGELALLLGKLIENSGFRNEFIQRFAAHLNTTFRPDRVIGIIDSLKRNIEAEMPAHIQRWNAPEDMAAWENEIQVLREFAANRPFFVREHLTEVFDLSGLVHLGCHVSGAEQGFIHVAGVPVATPHFEGLFFTGVPVRLTASANPGYRFAGWSGMSEGTNREISVVLSSDADITANFEPDVPNSLVINEIHYHPSDDWQGTDDNYEFIELYNPAGKDISLSGWSFHDGIDFIFPDGAVLRPGEYLILAKNLVTYKEASCAVYAFEKNLGNAGELISLYDDQGCLIDSVHYSDSPPWEALADGGGYSLELIHVNLDNGLPASWRASSAIGGSPGLPNGSTFADDVRAAPVSIHVG
ncbi:CotH kinase family protein, partial [bacterium]|nr:CotH kinase family protein [bacterium]